MLTVSESSIKNWTISTIECVELCKIQETTSANAAAAIFSILRRNLSHHTGPAEEDALHANILQLCQDAFQLRMLMRKSKHRYTVETVQADKGVSLAAVESKVDSVSVEGGKSSERSDEIAFAVFGALVKRPWAGDGTAEPAVKVLEKAQVVLRRR